MAALWLRRHPFRVSLFSIVAIASFCGACSSSSVGINTPSSTKCAVTVTNSLQTVPPSGASGTLTVATNRDCTWAASSGVAWIVITGGSSGQGDGSVAYRVAANTDSSSRRGAIDVNSAQVTIAQDAACRFEVSASSTTVSAEGGSVTVNVQSGGTCGWTAASQSDWIAVANGSSGTGDGVATLSVSPNHGAARNGHVTVAGQTITIAQAGMSPGPPTCNLSINPTS